MTGLAQPELLQMMSGMLHDHRRAFRRFNMSHVPNPYLNTTITRAGFASVLHGPLLSESDVRPHIPPRLCVRACAPPRLCAHSVTARSLRTPCTPTRAHPRLPARLPADGGLVQCDRLHARRRH
ncbi:hypothetical protein EON67_01250 [archaeon]|nr:MAG: hypothetical protein EON67_01250 [archaeon]